MISSVSLKDSLLLIWENQDDIEEAWYHVWEGRMSENGNYSVHNVSKLNEMVNRAEKKKVRCLGKTFAKDYLKVFTPVKISDNCQKALFSFWFYFICFSLKFSIIFIFLFLSLVI